MKKSSQAVKPEKTSQVVVIGTSAGGLSALKELISQLTKDFPLPVTVLERAKKSQVHIDRIRTILKTTENEGGNDMPS